MHPSSYYIQLVIINLYKLPLIILFEINKLTHRSINRTEKNNKIKKQGEHNYDGKLLK